MGQKEGTVLQVELTAAPREGVRSTSLVQHQIPVQRVWLRFLDEERELADLVQKYYIDRGTLFMLQRRDDDDRVSPPIDEFISRWQRVVKFVENLVRPWRQRLLSEQMDELRLDLSGTLNRLLPLVQLREKLYFSTDRNGYQLLSTLGTNVPFSTEWTLDWTLESIYVLDARDPCQVRNLRTLYMYHTH